VFKAANHKIPPENYLVFECQRRLAVWWVDSVFLVMLPDSHTLYHVLRICTKLRDDEWPLQEWRCVCGRPPTTGIHQICRDTHGCHSDRGPAAGGGHSSGGWSQWREVSKLLILHLLPLSLTDISKVCTYHRKILLKGCVSHICSKWAKFCSDVIFWPLSEKALLCCWQHWAT